ncbi:winged helix-turn-helix transcriptional regulator [Acrocarpospora catenulata]|uniref:winged helix-turn-helix transcriptional regulator n=1 Tax=Acrocarpospora catenulata TaxID=2836182 RepID=UPI001BDA53CB|nr:helix-turn-helix domain-containing protein [Acrocarpospora catenulata]
MSVTRSRSVSSSDPCSAEADRGAEQDDRAAVRVGLTFHLRGLEENGLVERRIHPVVPPRVDYSLGRTLLDTVQQLMEWAVVHLDDIEAARRVYAERQAALKEAQPARTS